MPHQTLFVFDIETVPDDTTVRNLTGYEGADVAGRRAELERYHLEITEGRNAFLRQPFHRVVAISFLTAEIHREGGRESYVLNELRSGGETGYDEKTLLQGFFQYFERLKPRLVSFNGRTFDLPVLKYRAMRHGIPAAHLFQAGDKWESYGSRYACEWHCDLLEVLSDYGASSRVRLNEVSAVLGLPGKFGPDGSQVQGMWDEGRIKEIRDYCETDVLNSYLVYLRWQLLRGVLSLDDHNRAVADVISLIQAEHEPRPHLADFLAAWGEACGEKFLL
jgi:predicted PolB exonuclease-like 3'-5' exonuclease